MGRSGRKEHGEIREKLAVWEYLDFADAGVFVEVGAHDPKNLSQTWFLERMGWTGVLVEPLPDKCEALRRERPASRVFEAAVSAPDRCGEADFYTHGMFSSLEKNVIDNQIPFDSVIRVRVVTLESVLQEAGIGPIDFLSIDTEGTELDVLSGLDIAAHRPRLVLVEDHVHSLDIHNDLRGKRYRLIRRTGFNNWYAPEGAAYRPPLLERLRLFRKMRLGTPLRALKFRREKRRKEGA